MEVERRIGSNKYTASEAREPTGSYVVDGEVGGHT